VGALIVDKSEKRGHEELQAIILEGFSCGIITS
jgi:hypothetical protein